MVAKLDPRPRPLQFESLTIHGGQAPEPVTGAVMPPIFQTSTYAQRAPGQHSGFEYSRTQNPTRFALERAVAALEGGTHGLAFASGCAATTTVLQLFDAGAHILAGHDLYGGTMRLFNQVMARRGLAFTYVDARDPSQFESAVKPQTKLVWIETPTNPLLELADISAIAAICRARGVLLAVDNTFMSPAFQRPLDLGADLVVHSATKYLGGHSDVVGGVIVTGREDLADRLAFLQNSCGAIAAPFDSYLVLRGLKTLALRMRQHQANAQRIAEHLEAHPAVARVIYPGLPSHPQHDLARRQMSGFGGMISVELRGGLAAAQRLLTHLELFTLAESLGGVESLIESPALMTHASVPEPHRRQLGLTDGLIRLSVGIEHVDDLIDDLDRGLDGLAAK
ncbi:MAG: cystathionine gamma-synthase [Myxococcales bacterium FL481]|nr:MAG: cystathionine gamma-synthase [Myxococcales bacterium FL481]